MIQNLVVVRLKLIRAATRLLAGVLPLVPLSTLATTPGTQGVAIVGSALDRPAVLTTHASRSILQSSALAGGRLVAVGERGIIILSDDNGTTWKQVSSPTSVGLTAVRFFDKQHGRIVGHGGLVLATDDGGETWLKQMDGRVAAQLVLQAARKGGDSKIEAEAQRYVDDGPDKPLLDTVFVDASHGFVVGAYNLAFETVDGGKTWRPMSFRLDNPKSLHLYAIRARGDEIVIAGEQGLVLRSINRGNSFTRLTLPYTGSFFVLELPGEREIVVAGLRGNAWRSLDGGKSWEQLKGAAPLTFTASALDAQGRLVLGNQAGMLFTRVDDVLRRTSIKFPPLTSLLPLRGAPTLTTTLAGVMSVDLEVLK